MSPSPSPTLENWRNFVRDSSKNEDVILKQEGVPSPNLPTRATPGSALCSITLLFILYVKLEEFDEIIQLHLD